MRRRNTTIRFLLGIVLSTLASLGAGATTGNRGVADTSGAPSAITEARREVRAVWLTTIGGLDWPHSYAQSERSIEKQKDELRRLLDLYRQAGINTVLLQTRVRGTVIYPSAYEPWDGCLSGAPGKSPGYDALRFAIDECHRRGMELHAWVVTIPVGKWNALGCKRLRQRFPGLIRKIGPDGYMNPEKPQTGDYIASLCEEITRNYDVDGIHLDYIRYPETWNTKVDGSKGRSFITAIVRKIRDKVKPLKPWVKLSCSPVGKHDDLTRYWSHGWNAYTKVCQDAQGWLRDGLMDALFPMMYFRGDQFYPFAIDWQENASGKIVAPGLGIYFMHPREGNWPLQDITREMEVLRSIGLGHAFFRGKFLTDNVKGIYDFTCRFNAAPALVPAMTWQSKDRPATPRMHYDKRQQALIVEPVADTYYNIYVDGQLTLARTLLTTIPFRNGHWYAIRAMNRYGNESEAAFYPPLPTPGVASVAADNRPGMLACDGRRLALPDPDRQLDAAMLVATTLQGSIVATWPNRGTSLDVSRLDNGCYVLRSLNRKGKTHRLGFFRVKRF